MSEQTSKFLSLVLRHAPERIGIALDAQGWTDVDELIAKANASGVALDRATLEEIVATSTSSASRSRPTARAFVPRKVTRSRSISTCRHQRRPLSSSTAPHARTSMPFSPRA